MALLSVSNLTFGYPENLEIVFDNVSFQIDSRWKTGLIGRNGRGKTTLLQLLMGKHPYQGTITTGGEIFSYFPCPVSDPTQNTMAILQSAAGSLPLWQLERELSLLAVDADVMTRPFETLSGGEQTKSLLAAMFLQENRFLLIDEPTNHLDAAGREIVAAYLAQKQGFILVSHDRAFLDGCVDHILAFNRADIEVQQGNFSSWQENRRRQDQFEFAQIEKRSAPFGRSSQAKSRLGQRGRAGKNRF